MNSHPFSLDTTFDAKDAGEDKVDVEIGSWTVFGLGSVEGDINHFKQRLGAPPKSHEDEAWAQKGKPLMHGWFFLRPAMKGQDRNKLLIRSQRLKHSSKNLHHEAPLCGGYALFYPDKKPQPVTGHKVHRIKLRLSLNLQRFIRHQPKEDDPSLPGAFGVVPRLKARSLKRSSHGEESSFDDEDNWLPNTPSWQQYGAGDHFGSYLDLIQKQVANDIQRACTFSNPMSAFDVDGEGQVIAEMEVFHYSLSLVETLWEFPSSNPIADVFEIGARLMRLKKQGGSAKFYPYNHKQIGLTLNSPCFIVPVSEGVNLKLYAKTNRRIRFEIVQSEIMKQRADLLTEEKIPFDEKEHSPEELPHLLRALRRRAANQMNQLMKELRQGRDGMVKACSVVQLLSEVASAVHSSTFHKQERLEQLQTLLFFLCYQHGFRGSRKTGPYAAALIALEERGVIKYERPRQFYVLQPAYISAADALLSATEDPFFAIFDVERANFHLAKDGRVFRLRE
jgi:hypothetical protein